MFLYRGCKLTVTFVEIQSTRQRSHSNAPPFGHPLAKTVRLIVESNLLTRLCPLVSYRTYHLTRF